MIGIMRERKRPSVRHACSTGTSVTKALQLLAFLLVFATPSPFSLYPAGNLAVAKDEPGSVYFPETGYAVQGRFLAYWRANGSVAQFGYPVSSEFLEKSVTDGKLYTVQYFERAEYEFHPENQPPHDLLLSLLGAFQYGKKYPQGAPEQTPNMGSASILFPETGKRLGGTFLDYWETHGGLAVQGYPISDEFNETSPVDSKTYKVQYFERAVFEYHPENVGTPYEVLLSQLGRPRYRALYIVQPPPDIAVPVPPTTSSSALAYLRDALDYIQMNFIGRDKFDWVEIRREAFNAAQMARTPADTYKAIEGALNSLIDRHARLIQPVDNPLLQALQPTLGIFADYESGLITSVVTDSLADKAGVRMGDVIEQINGKARASLDASHFFVELFSGNEVTLQLRRDGERDPIELNIAHDSVYPSTVPQGRRLDGNLGYISLPGTSPLLTPLVTEHYASIGQQIIKDLDRTPICGWVVDLQLDGGGSLSPMLLAAEPVLGDGEVGRFIDLDGNYTNWSLRDGRHYYVQGAHSELVRQVDNPYRLKRPMPPVAVLFGGSTASAGEATLISFEGRPSTRTFGQLSVGMPTAPTGKAMSDNAFIQVSAVLEADRTGRVYGYNERIRPDEYVPVSRTPLPEDVGTDKDPVFQSSIEWLKDQPGCAR